MPNTLIEAMAAGLPSIATDVGAIPEMLEDGESGFLVDVRDVAALATSLERLGSSIARSAARLGALGPRMSGDAEALRLQAHSEPCECSRSIRRLRSQNANP